MVPFLGDRLKARQNSPQMAPKVCPIFGSSAGKANVSQLEGCAFESHFGHGWSGPSVIRFLKVGLARAKWMIHIHHG